MVTGSLSQACTVMLTLRALGEQKFTLSGRTVLPWHLPTIGHEPTLKTSHGPLSPSPKFRIMAGPS